ncbi:NAD(P)H-dependent oxidoreductase [Lactobacillus sp. PV012]|uniref:NAD(P)H-dependent oxidoreductase n=1 Tax=Lactobacillus sp. PV012 TaxID=2594494 RepID=UPI00224090B4|nr:NAD(P)H-dependent oxidoreductase [Lactobacillus sp. PV012]QNQ82814.1 NAD(P)H-dependent oxidoreductase [Lactobacillus sp. PV012]
MKVLAIAGSNEINSDQTQLLEYIKKNFNDKYDVKIMEAAAMPMFKEGVDEPEDLKNMGQAINEADAVIISTAESQNSVPSSLKSVVEWLSSAEHPFKEKPLLVIGAAKEPQGSARAQVRLKNVLASPGIGAIVFNNDEFMMGASHQQFDKDGNLPEGTAKFLKYFLEEFDEFYNTVSSRKEERK